jgi:hypothetical protein
VYVKRYFENIIAKWVLLSKHPKQSHNTPMEAQGGEEV